MLKADLIGWNSKTPKFEQQHETKFEKDFHSDGCRLCWQTPGEAAAHTQTARSRQKSRSSKESEKYLESVPQMMDIHNCCEVAIRGWSICHVKHSDRLKCVFLSIECSCLLFVEISFREWFRFKVELFPVNLWLLTIRSDEQEKERSFN